MNLDSWSWRRGQQDSCYPQEAQRIRTSHQRLKNMKSTPRHHLLAKEKENTQLAEMDSGVLLHRDGAPTSGRRNEEELAFRGGGCRQQVWAPRLLLLLHSSIKHSYRVKEPISAWQEQALKGYVEPYASSPAWHNHAATRQSAQTAPRLINSGPFKKRALLTFMAVLHITSRI